MPMTLPALFERLHGVQRSGEGYVAFCPAHDDRTQRSLSVTEKNGRILFKCFAGCPFEKIVGALTLRPERICSRTAQRSG